MKKFLLAILFPALLIPSSLKSQSLILADQGKTEYSTWESTPIPAASVFRSYFSQMTGVKLKKAADTLGPRILFRLLQKDEPNAGKLKEEGFVIRTVNKNLYFEARTPRGLRNAVFTFLEDYAGCRYFTDDCRIIPRKTRFTLPSVNQIENPAFDFRVVYYNQAFQPEYAAWHKLDNKVSESKNKFNNISDEWGLWVHTLHRLIPPINHFEKHPEYYAMRNGIRMPDQLCLSNPDVAKIVTASLQEEISKNPEALYWSVSQMDNYNYCECPKCRAIDSIEGSPAGSVIRFVNEIAKNFPDKIISTLAYQYSRKAPKLSKPLPNVNIMLCTIECDRSKPLPADFGSGSFAEDLKAWARLTDNILIWDYVINFSHICSPFPNLHVLQPNAQFFAENKVSGLFEQGWASKGGELNELRCYLLTKLAWNPSHNTDSLMREFTDAYYGNAATHIRQYISLTTNALKRSGHALTLYEPPGNHVSDYLSPGNLESALSLMEKARAAVQGNKTLEARVEAATLPLLYAWLETAKVQPFSSAWLLEADSSGGWRIKEKARATLKTFYSGVSKYGPPLLHETRLNPDEYKTQTENYFNTAFVNHLARGKKVNLGKGSSMQYPANGSGTLTDGVRGTTDYFNLWLGWWGEDADIILDLDFPLQIKEIVVGCLDDNKSWIIAPDSIQVSFSHDGYNFTPAALLVNPNAGNKRDASIISFTIPIPPDKAVPARWVKIHVSNYGKLPSWRGVDSDSWLFIDEVIVR